MSYGANDIKFEEGVETMMQTYQLWRKRWGFWRKGSSC